MKREPDDFEEVTGRVFMGVLVLVVVVLVLPITIVGVSCVCAAREVATVIAGGAR